MRSAAIRKRDGSRFAPATGFKPARGGADFVGGRRRQNFSNKMGGAARPRGVLLPHGMMGRSEQTGVLGEVRLFEMGPARQDAVPARPAFRRWTPPRNSPDRDAGERCDPIGLGAILLT